MAITDLSGLAVKQMGGIRFLSGYQHSVPTGKGLFHSHPGWEIVYHVSGRGRLRDKSGTQLAFGPGSAAIYPPALLHTQDMDAPGEDVCIVVAIERPVPSVLQRVWNISEISDQRIQAELVSMSKPHMRITEMRQAIWDHRAASLFLSLLGLASQPTAATASVGAAQLYAEEACRIVQEDYRSLAGLSDVAARVGISADYLRHVFKNRYGVGLKEYLIQTRLKRAEDLLLHSKLLAKEVADLCGFSTERYFCTAFRREKGTTPVAFRQSCQITGD